VTRTRLPHIRFDARETLTGELGEITVQQAVEGHV
jgi:hypothetical protein